MSNQIIKSLSKGSANLGFAQHFLKMSQWYRRSVLSFNSVLCDKLIDGATSLTKYSKVVSEVALSIYNMTFWDSCCERSKISFGKEQKQDRNLSIKFKTHKSEFKFSFHSKIILFEQDCPVVSMLASKKCTLAATLCNSDICGSSLVWKTFFI